MDATVKLVEWFDQHWYKLTLVNGTTETRWVPSVTTKLGIIDKPFLPKWRGDIGNREADMRLFEAQQRGSRIHDAWNKFCTGGTVIYNPWEHPNYTDEEVADLTKEVDGNIAIIKYQDEMLALVKLKRCVEILKPKMIASERLVYSLTNNDAGTMDNDWLIEEGEYPISGAKPLFIPGGRYIADLKTGSVVDDNAFCQTAAYAKCSEEMADAAKKADPDAPEPVKYQGTLILHTSALTKKGIEGFTALLRTNDQMQEDYQTYRITAELWERKNKGATPRVFEFPSMLTLSSNNNGGHHAASTTATPN